MRAITNKGFTFVEMMVALSIFVIIGAAGFMLFISGENLWMVHNAKMQMQQSIRQSLIRAGMELEESGIDKLGILQVSILDNAGVDGSDILRFSVPVCPCGQSILDENTDIRAWGAPLKWGTAGCSDDYPLEMNGKVAICHLPPGNPGNSQSIQVSENAVKAHLAHGDWIGSCISCNPNTYTNRKIEYLLDNDGQLLRRVLNSTNTPVNSVVAGRHYTDFQASLNDTQTIVTLSGELSHKALSNRTITVSEVREVYLRNRP